MKDTRIAAGRNSAHLAAQRKVFGVIPSHLIWGILACCFVFLSSQLSHASGACTTTPATQAPTNNWVLILAPTLADSNGKPTSINPNANLCTSLEAVKANDLGFDVEIDDAAAWGAKSTAQFATYGAIVLGDPNCTSGGDTTPITAAEANRSAWGPAISGPVAIVGTDPDFHFLNSSGPDAGPLTENAIAYATSTSGKPGAYISYW